ncbi:MAG: type II toxin-antitoxin system VapC family toxin [bacterium]|nr:type II toxin-antitoxin system VapC family toxin [bacterium]
MENLYPDSITFLDANIFLLDIFADIQKGNYCRNLISLVEREKVKGVTSVMVLDEVLFKMLIVETSKKFNIPIQGASRFLKANFEKLQSLNESWLNIKRIQSIPNLEIVGVSPDDFSISIELGKNLNLLPHDALHLAIMKRKGITSIVTSDPHFDNMEGITIYTPIEVVKSMNW